MAAIRLLIDEDVRPLLAETLRQRGFDARHVDELKRSGLSDLEQLAFAILMHHKRGKPKSTRAGCLLCKPHKHQAEKHHARAREKREGRWQVEQCALRSAPRTSEATRSSRPRPASSCRGVVIFGREPPVE